MRYLAAFLIFLSMPCFGEQDIASSSLQMEYSKNRFNNLFTIVLQNTGERDMHELRVLLQVTDALKLPKSDPLPKISDGPEGVKKLQWQIQKLPAGTQKKITVLFSVSRVEQIDTKASVYSGKQLLLEQHKRIWTRCPVCSGVFIRMSTYDTEDPVEVGSETVYVVELRNEGRRDKRNIHLVNFIPKEMDFISADPYRYTYDPQKRAIVFNPVPILRPGEKFIYKIVCRATKAGSAQNRAEVSYDGYKYTDEERTSVYR